MEQKQSRTTKGMSCPAPAEEPVVQTTILDDKAQPRELRNTGQERRKRKSGWESRYGGQTNHALTMAEWVWQPCASTVMNGGPAAVIQALDIRRSLMPSSGWFDARSGRQSREAKNCIHTE